MIPAAAPAAHVCRPLANARGSALIFTNVPRGTFGNINSINLVTKFRKYYLVYPSMDTARMEAVCWVRPVTIELEYVSDFPTLLAARKRLRCGRPGPSRRAGLYYPPPCA